MKVLTIKQSWAQLICSGIKDVENRSWKTNFRGEILIHAAAKDYDFKNQMTSEYQRHWIAQIKKPYTHGAIIGSVKIVDCIKSKDSKHKEWGNLYCWHWILEDAKLFEVPTPAKGKLSFWNFDENLLIQK